MRLNQTITAAKTIKIVALQGGRLVDCTVPTASETWFVMECEICSVSAHSTRLSYSTRNLIYNGEKFREVYFRPNKEGIGQPLAITHQTAEGRHDGEYQVSRLCSIGREIPKLAEKNRLDAAINEYLIDQGIQAG